ncbi:MULTISPECIES: GntR family transcriptional regulator [unclassified Mycoplasma]|uniref:GntR family transcriptional regulator n=1 Tax=unclassified Mycoplasma TaxID=2683645 RepID=UPI000FDE7E08
MNKKLSTRIFVQKYILLKINYGEWKPGEKIPSENALAIKFNCSRITIRNILQSLVYSSYLVPVKGKGYFVASVRIGANFIPISQEYDCPTAQVKMLSYQQLPYRETWIEMLGVKLEKTELEKARIFEKTYFDQEGQEGVYQITVLNSSEVILFDETEVSKSLSKYLVWQGVMLSHATNIVIYDHHPYYAKIARRLGWKDSYPFIVTLMSTQKSWVEISFRIVAKKLFKFARTYRIML